jgi:hypothetical protein
VYCSRAKGIYNIFWKKCGQKFFVFAISSILSLQPAQIERCGNCTIPRARKRKKKIAQKNFLAQFFFTSIVLLMEGKRKRFSIPTNDPLIQGEIQ